MVNQYTYGLGTAKSCIRDLFDFGLQRAAIVGKENVFDFSIGNPSIPAPASVNEAAIDIIQKEDSLLVHGYSSAPGFMDAREAIAKELAERTGTAISGSDLYFTCGAAPALIAVCKALHIDENTEILGIAPFFPEYRPFIESTGSKFVYVPADTKDFQIDLVTLEKMINKNTQAVIINSPNNPSGVVFSKETLEKVADILTKKSAEFGKPIYLISDEPYRELVYDGVDVPWVPSIYKDTIVCYSYSKSLSLPGERIGYIYVPQQAAQHDALFAAICGASRALGHVCAPSVWQKVIARCANLRPDLREYDRNRRTLYDALRRYGYELAQPSGAFYLFLRAPGGDANAFSELAKREDLLIVPGDDFGCPGWLRVCYCVRRDTVVRSLPIFRRLIETHGARDEQFFEKIDKKLL